MTPLEEFQGSVPFQNPWKVADSAKPFWGKSMGIPIESPSRRGAAAPLYSQPHTATSSCCTQTLRPASTGLPCALLQSNIQHPKVPKPCTSTETSYWCQTSPPLTSLLIPEPDLPASKPPSAVMQPHHPAGPCTPSLAQREMETVAAELKANRRPELAQTWVHLSHHHPSLALEKAPFIPAVSHHSEVG